MPEPQPHSLLPQPFRGSLRIGLGCAAMLGARDRKESANALALAYDLGIRHFDVARSYGFGAAEAILGGFIKGMRDQVSLTTKIGIAPPRQSSILDLAKSVARKVIKIAPGTRALVKTVSSPLLAPALRDARSLALDFETSLKELQTDHVDFLLIHGGTVESIDPDVVELGSRLVAKGAVKRFGIASDWWSATAVASRYRDAMSVIQAEANVFNANERAAPARSGTINIGHSPFGGGRSRQLAQFAASTERVRQWSERLDADCSDLATIPQLLLRWTMMRPELDMVVFSSFSKAHIQRNIETATSPPLTPKQEENLVKLAIDFSSNPQQ